MERNNNEPIDALTIRQMLETFEINDKARKKNELKIINEIANIMIQPQIDEIIERQERASERCERNIAEIHKRHQIGINKLAGKRGK